MITWNRLAVHICQISQLVISSLLCSVVAPPEYHENHRAWNRMASNKTVVGNTRACFRNANQYLMGFRNANQYLMGRDSQLSK